VVCLNLAIIVTRVHRVHRVDRTRADIHPGLPPVGFSGEIGELRGLVDCTDEAPCAAPIDPSGTWVGPAHTSCGELPVGVRKAPRWSDIGAGEGSD
jgi:hypothetical protein